MTIGRPFEKGRPKTGGRKPGVANKEPRLPAERLGNRIRRHIDRSMARHEAGIDKIADPAEALRIDARFNRDLVEMLSYTSRDEEANRDARISDAQAQEQAREAGPVTDVEAMRAYRRMCDGEDTDELRVLLARMDLGAPGRPKYAHHPGYVALLEAIASGQYECRGEVTLADVLMRLAAPQTRAALEPVQHASARHEPDPQPYAGFPLADGSGRLIPAAPRQLRQPREPYADPPMPGRVFDAEEAAIATGLPVPLDEERPSTREREELDPWDDPSVTVVMGPPVR